jgi:hypothetical protein
VFEPRDERRKLVMIGKSVRSCVLSDKESGILRE